MLIVQQLSRYCTYRQATTDMYWRIAARSDHTPRRLQLITMNKLHARHLIQLAASNVRPSRTAHRFVSSSPLPVRHTSPPPHKLAQVVNCMVTTHPWTVLVPFVRGAETWTLKKADMKRMAAFEMACYRIMLRISWRQHRTNASVPDEV